MEILPLFAQPVYIDVIDMPTDIVKRIANSTNLVGDFFKIMFGRFGIEIEVASP